MPGDTNSVPDVFVRDFLAGTTKRVSVASGALQANGPSGFWTMTISDGGALVAFESVASNLVAGDTNSAGDVFVHDLRARTTTRVSVSSSGTQAAHGGGVSGISGNGRFVAFRSYSPDLVPGDTNNFGDVLVHDTHASGFTAFCEPGAAGKASCPCSNPPSGSGRGCDTSAATGGAMLAASGAAYLFFDDLVLTTSGELPSVTSMVVQANASSPTGTTFGQGVRCVGGSLLTLYVKQANAGSLTAPDFAAGDPSVSARSAQLGDPISAKSSRYYLVVYRDPQPVGGCPTSSTFNATQAGEVAWSL